MIGTKLKELRTKRGLTIAGLCNELQMNQNTYAKYERNERDVSTDTLSSIADFYGVTTDYLLGREPLTNPLQGLNIGVEAVDSEKFIEAYDKLPDVVKQVFIDTMLKLSQAASERQKEGGLISVKFFEKTAVSAGTGLYDDNNEYPTVKQVPDSSIARDADFCCYVSGHSMEPLFSDGDLICVKAQQSVDIGEIGVFVLNGEMYIKMLGTDELISINPAYPNIKKSPDIVCQGRVLGKIE